MRALGAAYDAAVASREARPCWRIQLAGWGGAPDPLDITDHVALVDVDRPLRDGNSATIRLSNETGQFDPVGGLYAAAVQPANAEVRIDFGEILGGVPTYWRVFTGEIHAAMPDYRTETGMIDLECLDRGINVWQHTIASPEYYSAGATPAYYTCHQIVEDLFTRFAGFAPADFNLDPLSDWQLDRAAQFEQEPIASAAGKCLQATGYRMWFDYYGRVTSGLLIPTGAPATWAVAGTILEENIAQIDGPSAQPPTATRVQAVGGGYPWPMWNIGEPTIWATARWGWGGGPDPGDWSGDIRSTTMGAVGGQVTLHIWGDPGNIYRSGGSYLDITYEVGGAGCFTVLPGIVPGTEIYDWALGRQVLDIYFQQTDLMPARIQMDLWGYPMAIVNHQVFVQHWNELLRARWGERRLTIDNPLIYTWTQGDNVTDQEMTVAELSQYPASVMLSRPDLRIEPGDVWTVENPRGGAFTLWVERVIHAANDRTGETRLEGYVIT
jgi:hypothetical protein